MNSPVVFISAINQVVGLHVFENVNPDINSFIFKVVKKLTYMQDPLDNCPSCDQYIFFLITAGIEVN